MTGAGHGILSRRQMVAGTLAASMMAAVAPLRAAGAAGDTVEAAVIEELVTANRILAELEIVDAFGHISRRHPSRPANFLMSRARAPGLIEPADIMEFNAAGEPVGAQGRSPYLERYIHAAIYAARPDVNSVIHDHSEGVIPFSVSDQPLRPVSHTGGILGTEVPVWEIRTKFGDKTNMLVSTLEMGRDLAQKLDKGPAILMRGHGAVLAGPSIRLAVSLANALERQAIALAAARQLGTVNYLSPGEAASMGAVLSPKAPVDSMGRAWEVWCKQVGRPYTPKGY